MSGMKTWIPVRTLLMLGRFVIHHRRNVHCTTSFSTLRRHKFVMLLFALRIFHLRVVKSVMLIICCITSRVANEDTKESQNKGGNFKQHSGYSNTYLIDLLACQQRLPIKLVLRKMRFFPMIILGSSSCSLWDIFCGNNLVWSRTRNVLEVHN